MPEKLITPYAWAHHHYFAPDPLHGGELCILCGLMRSVYKIEYRTDTND